MRFFVPLSAECSSRLFTRPKAPPSLKLRKAKASEDGAASGFLRQAQDKGGTPSTTFENQFEFFRKDPTVLKKKNHLGMRSPRFDTNYIKELETT